MFETIGMVAVWVFGAAVSFYGPMLGGLVWRGGLETVVLGVLIARVCLGLYLVVTVTYFIIT